MLHLITRQFAGQRISTKHCFTCKKFANVKLDTMLRCVPPYQHLHYHSIIATRLLHTSIYTQPTTHHQRQQPRTHHFHSSVYKSKYLIPSNYTYCEHKQITTNLVDNCNNITCQGLYYYSNTKHVRRIHTLSRCLKQESKIENTLKAIKEKTAELDDIKDHPQPPKAPSTEVKKVKPTIWRRVVNEVKHYYHGFRLLFIDFRVALRIVWSLRDGRTLTRRERRQLVRTTADLFRLVPFLVFVIVPFMEFLLPFALKFFPGMLPSTFESENRKQEKLKKTLKGKLEMAKFLQDTIEESSLQRKDGATGDHLVTDFSDFLNKIRTSGELASVEDIKKYSKLFTDEITLDNLSRDQLRAICRVLELPSIGPDYLLRFSLRVQLRRLMADDKMILKEGVDSMTTWELQHASKQRGMRALGQSEERLREQLQQWADMHVNQEIPTSLLLLSRAMYISETIPVPTTDQLQATLSTLTEATTEEAKLKAAELSGDKVDNLAKLQRIKEEEVAIKKEKAEILSDKELAENMERKLQEKDLEPGKDEELIETAVEMDVKEMAKEESEKITQQELVEIEAAIETLAEEKKMSIDMEELDDLKEDISDYREDVEELKEVIVACGGNEQDLRESKAAIRLSKKMSRLIGEMDGFIEQLHKEKRSLQEEIEVKEVRIKHSDEPTTRDQMMGEIDEQKTNIVSINDLLLSLKRLQKVPGDTRMQRILEVLDEDQDGVIQIDTVLKVIETLGKENIKLSKEQVTDVINLIKRESALEKEEKKEKDKEEEKASQSDESDNEKSADKSS